MSESPFIAYYDALYEIINNSESSLLFKYKSLRALLERICKGEMDMIDLQVTDLSARISFIADKFDLLYIEQQRLHTLRLTANSVMNLESKPNSDSFLRDAKTIAFFIKKIYGEEIPDNIFALLPKYDHTYQITSGLGRKYSTQIRVCFQYADEDYLYVIPTDGLSEEILKVQYNIKEYNEEFKDIDKILWRHAQLNLLDVRTKDGILQPQIIVLEPDYLIDISALAECYRPYGPHPYNYILSRLQPINNPRPLLLGSIANHFLDEWIYADKPVDYIESMQKVFKKYAIELASCPDLDNPKLEKEFFDDCLKHFNHIDKVVNTIFEQDGVKINKSDAVLEPSYICEALGIQGRLDYLQGDLTALIEMKSGKADEFTLRGKTVPFQNHRVQMLLYQAVLYFNMQKDYKEIRAYLLYTRYPLLYPARSSWRMVREAINLRNKIVATEFSIQSENSIDYTATILQQITPGNVNINNLSGKLWRDYLEPPIAGLQSTLAGLGMDERAYYYATYNFITKELYTSKSGDMDYESKRGASSLWNASLVDKLDEGAILLDLKILENSAADIHKPHIIFSKELFNKKEGLTCLPNFREGDSVVFYERNTLEDNVTNKLVFKGNIEFINDLEVSVRLRAAQKNIDVVHTDSLYALEPDSMDTTYRNMFLSLDSFLSATQSRKDLILGKRAPQFEESLYKQAEEQSNDLERIVGKAIAAKDYLLLVGPPGTGKTSFALRRMVEEFYISGKNILLLAYTNQAVDEICKSISKINSDFPYIRLGNELSCHPLYRHKLLEEVLSQYSKRKDVKKAIQDCNVYVSTVASLSGKMDLFRLKQFDVTIIDEASQILEPQLLGLLTAKHGTKEDAIKKFILIGDHKQLPAVVQQKERTSAIESEELKRLHIYNMRDALFERLYRLDYPKAKEMLLRQGRMHPEIAEFVNKTFYHNKLSSLNLGHQQEKVMPIPRISLIPNTPEVNLKSRVVFIPSELSPNRDSNKINEMEAEITAHLCSQIVKSYSDKFESTSTVGVITPYRSQIALIKSKLAAYNCSNLNGILVDTVERFQGSERDIIIYSFCVNSPYQLDFLCNILYEQGVPIDRKLNVALTRARKQLFLIGVPQLLRLNKIYKSLLDFIEPKMS